MFKTFADGFHIRFANGWTFSAQWREGNYCDRAGGYGLTVEIAAWPGESADHRQWHRFGDHQVKGWVSPDEVLAFMNEIAAKAKL